jgi:hypothetical protein
MVISVSIVDSCVSWFRLIDLNTDRVVWMLRVPEVFEYQKDRPVGC